MQFDKNKTACFSGYRPHKFDFPLSGNEYDLFTHRLLDEIIKAIANGYDTFLTGCAPGFDIIAAELIIMAKRIHKTKDIKMVCALPFGEFSESTHFDKHWRERYDHIIEFSHETINVTGNPHWVRSCYSLRNRFLVDNSSLLICYSTGKNGGTENTVQYAKKSGVRIINIA